MSSTLPGQRGVDPVATTPMPTADGTLHLVTSAAPGPPLISADAAARVLCDYFLFNADRGDHAANDELVAELALRMHARRVCNDGACSQATAEAAVLRHRTRGIR